MGLSFALAFFGFAALAAAMRRHHRDLFGTDLSRWRNAVLRAVGALALAVSYDHLGNERGVVEGTIDWLCLLPIAAILVVITLSAASLLRAPRARNRAPSPTGSNEDALPRAAPAVSEGKTGNG
jgi:hypothetical protein